MSFRPKVGLVEGVKKELAASAATVLSDDVLLADRTYVVGYRGTDEFLARTVATGFETVKWSYGWTADRAKVLRLTWASLVESGLLMGLTIAYGRSVFMLRIK